MTASQRIEIGDWVRQYGRPQVMQVKEFLRVKNTVLARCQWIVDKRLFERKIALPELTTKVVNE